MRTQLLSIRGMATAAAAALMLCGGAQASSVVGTTIGADLTLLSVDSAGSLDGFTIEWDAVGGETQATDGTGQVVLSQDTFIATNDPLAIGVGFDLSSEILADANASPIGSAEFTVDEIALITFTNLTSNDVTVSWGLNVFVDAFASVSGAAPVEDAFVFSSLDVALNGDLVYEYSALGDVLDIAEETISEFELIEFVIEANGIADVELVLLTEGLVVSEVPVVGALPLFMTAATAFGFIRRRKRLAY